MAEREKASNRRRQIIDDDCNVVHPLECHLSSTEDLLPTGAGIEKSNAAQPDLR